MLSVEILARSVVKHGGALETLTQALGVTAETIKATSEAPEFQAELDRAENELIQFCHGLLERSTGFAHRSISGQVEDRLHTARLLCRAASHWPAGF